MRPGDIVIYVGSPDGESLYGKMLFLEAAKNGLMECVVCPDAWHARSEYFRAHELQLAPALEVA